jgi:fibro-slime domain-containing protein
MVHDRTVRCTLWMVGVVLAVSVAAVAFRAPLARLKPPVGLHGRYYAGLDWSGTPLLERTDREITTELLAKTSELAQLTSFSIEWSGFLVTSQDAIHRFASKSDDGSWIWIDDQLVVDNGGLHAAQNITSELFLPRGVHHLRIRYLQGGGAYSLQFGQAAFRGHYLYPNPLTPEPTTYFTFRARQLWPLLMAAMWFVALLGLVYVALRTVMRHSLFAPLRESARDRRFWMVAVISLAFSVAHIAYGMPAREPLSGDELEPLGTLTNYEFAFRDWNLRWPPLHLSLIALILMPFKLAGEWFELDLWDQAVAGTMFIVIRTLSVAMLLATLLVTFDVARRWLGAVAGYFAVALLALSPVVVYFGSLANLEIPHLFWVTLSFWACLELIERRSVSSAVFFGTSVGFSLATKDQAYAYYLLVPFALVHWIGRGADTKRPWREALVDKRILATGAAALLAFSIGHQLPWAWDRLVAHVRSIVTVDILPFRVFDRSFDGYVGLVAATIKSFVWAAGWPLVVAAVGGVAVALTTGKTRLLAFSLAPIISYCLGFIAVILYVYDRFLIAALPIAALLGGGFLAWLVGIAQRTGQRWPLAVPIGLLVVASLNAAAQSVVLYNDPRHSAAEWLARNAPCGSSVGVTFDNQYVPDLYCRDVWDLLPSRMATMVRFPDRVILNEAYSQRFRLAPDGRRFLTRLSNGQLGYELAYRAEAVAPRWAPMYWEERFLNRREDPFTILDKPLHAIEVWERQGLRSTAQPASH